MSALTLTAREVVALLTIYRAEASPVDTILMTDDAWEALVVTWRALAARGFVVEEATPAGPGFWLTAEGRAVVAAHARHPIT